MRFPGIGEIRRPGPTKCPVHDLTGQAHDLTSQAKYRRTESKYRRTEIDSTASPSLPKMLAQDAWSPQSQITPESGCPSEPLASKGLPRTLPEGPVVLERDWFA